MDVLTYQENMQVVGPMLEIGVFCGKYFSILARAAQRCNVKLLGIDTFQWTYESKVRESLALSPETARADVTLWKRLSQDCTADEIIGHLGGKPRFISLDGSHEFEDVYLDLELTERLVSPSGIIAVDDFLNPMTLGVNQAVHRFFACPRLVVPVAYISNKLFLTHRSAAQGYRAFIEHAIVDDQGEPESRNFRDSLSKARHFVEQPLWGYPVLIA